MSPNLLEQYVFAKPYFDRHGLIVAEDRDRIVGFAHAGFGADDSGMFLSKEMGAICLVLVAPHERREEIARELVAQAEDYLRRQGTKLIYGGGIHPVDPFYLGLYGGSELPGVLASDELSLELFRGLGYQEIDRCVILERDLVGFRPRVDRRQMQIRRLYGIEATFDPAPVNWWEACTFGLTDRTRFDLRPRDGGSLCCTVTFWDMEPLASSWGVHAVGLTQLKTVHDRRRQGLATFLIGEALRQLTAHGVQRCQVLTMQHNSPALALYQKLGFVEVDQGIVFRKPSSP